MSRIGWGKRGFRQQDLGRRMLMRSRASSSFLPDGLKAPLGKILRNTAYLTGAYVNGLYIKAKICNPFVSHVVLEEDSGASESGRQMALFFTFEQMDAARAVPLGRLQRQAWQYLLENAKYFPGELQRSWNGSIVRGIFTGRKAFQELLILIGITGETSLEELIRRMQQDGGVAMHSPLLLNHFENALKFEVKTHAAVALTCFGGADVIRILQGLSALKSNYAETLNSVARDVLLRHSHFSALYLGVMFSDRNLWPVARYSGRVPEELQEEVDALRYSGQAFAIARELDRYHDDPRNREHFREVTISLPVDARDFAREHLAPING